MYIVLEGIDGSGKSSAATSLHERLNDDLFNSIINKHPGSTKLGQELRHIIKHRTDIEVDRFTEQLLIFADHCAFVNQILRPALENETIVIADRSNLIGAYAYGIAGGVKKEEIAAFHSSLPNMPKIDLLLLFQCPWNIAKERVSTRGEQCKIESRGDEYFNKVSEGYQAMEGNMKDTISKYTNKIISIDATLPQNAVADLTYMAVTDLL